MNNANTIIESAGEYSNGHVGGEVAPAAPAPATEEKSEGSRRAVTEWKRRQDDAARIAANLILSRMLEGNAWPATQPQLATISRLLRESGPKAAEAFVMGRLRDATAHCRKPRTEDENSGLGIPDADVKVLLVPDWHVVRIRKGKGPDAPREEIALPKKQGWALISAHNIEVIPGHVYKCLWYEEELRVAIWKAFPPSKAKVEDKVFDGAAARERAAMIGRLANLKFMQNGRRRPLLGGTTKKGADGSKNKHGNK